MRGPVTNENPILVELFRHNQWANATTLDACPRADGRAECVR